MGLLGNVEEWVVHKALGRAVARVAVAAASYAAAHTGLAQSWGVSFSMDPATFANGLTAAILGGFHFLENWWSLRHPAPTAGV